MLKGKSRYFFLIVILTSLFSISLISNTMICKSSLDNANYNSDGLDDLRSSNPDITIITPENITYTTPMSGYYPGTFGFENDEIGNVPTDWVDNSEAGCSIYVISEKNNHKNVLLLDDDSANKVYGDVSFSNQSYGTVEVWILMQDCTNAIGIRLTDTISGSNMFRFLINEDKWKYHDGSTQQVISAFDGVYDPLDNTWYHIKIHFRCNGAPSYQGLNENKFKVVIDGHESEELDAMLIKNAISKLIFTTTAATTVDAWIDAVGYSWDPNYNIGDNLNEGLLLSFDTIFTPDWLGYSLDDQVNRTILGNTIFPFPSQEGLHTVQVFGNDSLGAKFESEVRYFSAKMLNIITPENITYTAPMSGYYPATYGFENDENSAVPNGWIDNSQPGCSGKVISEKLGHKKVLHLKDDSGNKVYLDTNFLNRSYGTIEMWVLSEDCTDGIKIRGAERISTTQLFRFGIGQDKWVYYDGVSYLPSTNLDGVYDPLDNTWYHLKILFRCNGAPSYQGLGENKFKVIIDGTYESEEIDFWNVKNNMNRLTLTTGAVDTNDEWVDAIGYSWDSNYDIGVNRYEGLLLSFENSTTLDWIGYSLDGQLNNTILGNTTFPYPSIEGLHTLQVFGNNSIGTMYQSDVRYFTTKMLNIITPENITYTVPMSAYYPATYGFENDEVNSVPAEWTDQSGGSTYVKVIASEDGHNKILQLYDTTGGDPYAINPIDNIESGTVEFWMKNVDMSERIYFAPRHGTDQLFRVLLADNMVVVTAQGGTGYDLAAAAADTWHHVSVDFECGTGGYKGLGQNQFAVTYKGIRYGPYNFWTSALYTDNIAFSGFHGHGNYYYVDAIGYSWDSNYDIGDNRYEGLLLSFENSTTLDWIGYSLDGQLNNTILGNTTFPYPSIEGLHTLQVFGNDSIGTMFESDIRYFTIKFIEIITPKNRTYTEPMNGYYPGTFGFEDEVDGTSRTDIKYVDNTNAIQSNCYVDIQNNYQGHNKVLRVYDGSTAGNAEAQQYFTSTHTSGTIEWWWCTAMGGTGAMWYHFHEGTMGTIAVSLAMANGEFRDMDGNMVQLITTNRWYHHKLTFNTASDTYDWYIDNVLMVDDGNFPTPVSNIGSTNIKGSWANTGSCYVDAISYSWDPDYNIRDNRHEGLLLSFEHNPNLEWTAYSLDGNNNNTIFGNKTIPMPDNGFHSVQVFGNNSLGDLFASDIRYFTMDITITPPQILINSPLGGNYFGFNAPNYDISITTSYFDSKWYTLDAGSTNITFVNELGTIDQIEWENYGHGAVTIRFYVNDTYGQEEYDEVTINKDLNPPSSTLSFTPYMGINIVNKSTVFTIIATDFAESGVSIIRYKINNSGWLTYSGSFTLLGFSPGDYTITYQAIDVVGNVESEQSIVVDLYHIPEPPPELPIEIIILIIVLVAVGSALAAFATLFVYKRGKSRIFIDEKKPKQIKIRKQNFSTESRIFSCPFCQAEQPGGQKFCVYCGANLEE